MCHGMATYVCYVTVNVQGNNVSSDWDINLSVALFFQICWFFLLYESINLCIHIFYINIILYYSVYLMHANF